MFREICIALSRDPTDPTIYINTVTRQVIERNYAEQGYTGDSCYLILYEVFSSGYVFLNSRQRAKLFHAAFPPPLVQRPAAVQSVKRRGAKMEAEQLRAAEETMDALAAARLNRVDVLRQLVLREGNTVLAVRDTAGHTAAHWAALEGHLEVIQFMIDHGGPFNAVSQHPLRQHPVHWACVNGHIPVIEALLKADVSVDQVDAHGCTPLITACQYGQTSAAAFLMGRGAQLQACDEDGDNALHWAANRGRPELVRLLVYSGFNPHQRDHQGQGPIHLAAISGNLCTVRDLCCIDRVNLMVTDANGRTPLMLAKGRRHDDISAFLENELHRKEGGLWGRINLRSLAFGPPGRKREAQLGFILICGVIMYPTYIFKVGPALYSEAPLLQLLFLAFNVLSWISFYKSSTMDPGFVPPRQPEYDRIMQQVGNIEAWSHSGQSVLDRLCHTCRIVKPYRAKHCRICDRCVRHMDHHCPYIYNCVGYENRGWFFLFIYSVLAIAMLSFYFSYLVLTMRGLDLLIVMVLPFGIFGLCIVGSIGFCLWYMAVSNMTTNEMANKHRYSYFRNSRGDYRNPFSRGIISNVMEFFHWKAPIPLMDYQMQRMADIL